ncbi:hypothetical protein PAPHI01_2150 [Pancytospora philotis]|nr:hypothetical protein PAPHI01_2150 [Pancytospora philotis]
MDGGLGDVRVCIRKFIDSCELGAGKELELRLGRLCSRITKERVVLPAPHPIVYQKNAPNMSFVSGVAREDYDKIKAELAKVLGNAAPKEAGQDTGTAPEISQSTDAVLVLSGNVRVVRSESALKYQSKKRLKCITIHFPLFKYDVRIALSQETELEPVEIRSQSPEVIRLLTLEAQPGAVHEADRSMSEEASDFSSVATDDQALKRQKAVYTVVQKRYRARESYTFEDYVFDLTEVKSHRDSADNSIYEVELEVLKADFDREKLVSKALGMANIE